MELLTSGAEREPGGAKARASGSGEETKCVSHCPVSHCGPDVCAEATPTVSFLAPSPQASPLHLAVTGDYIDCVRGLLDAGADRTALDNVRSSFVVAALRQGGSLVAVNHHALSLPRCSAAASAHLVTPIFYVRMAQEGRTPEDVAKTDAIRAVLNQPLEPEDAEPQEGAPGGEGSGRNLPQEVERDPHVAAARGDAASLRALAKEGCNLDEADEDGFTPLMVAARHGHAEALAALIAAGADMEAQCKLGNTSLHYASANGRLACVATLVAEDCEKDTQNAEGHTPLAAAALNGHPEVCRTLLVHGAKDDIAGRDGRVPLDLSRTSHVRAILAKAPPKELERGANCWRECLGRVPYTVCVLGDHCCCDAARPLRLSTRCRRCPPPLWFQATGTASAAGRRGTNGRPPAAAAAVPAAPKKAAARATTTSSRSEERRGGRRGSVASRRPRATWRTSGGSGATAARSA